MDHEHPGYALFATETDEEIRAMIAKAVASLRRNNPPSDLRDFTEMAITDAGEHFITLRQIESL